MQKSKRIATNNSTNNDTNINGANITADNIIINSGNDLNIASLQNTSNSSSKSKSIGAGGGKSSASLNYSSSKSEFSRNWVDDQTDITASNNLTINTANNTDLKGALINSETDNLTINTATLTYSDIIDTEIQESSSFGISTNISVGQHSKNPDASNPNQDKSYYPDGSTTLSMANNGYEKEQITRATIGSGIINITNNNNNQTQDITSLNRDINKNQEITKDTITGALNIQTTIDNRIIGAIIGNEGAQDSLVKTIRLGSEALLTGKVFKKGIDDVGEVYNQADFAIEGLLADNDVEKSIVIAKKDFYDGVRQDYGLSSFDASSIAESEAQAAMPIIERGIERGDYEARQEVAGWGLFIRGLTVAASALKNIGKKSVDDVLSGANKVKSKKSNIYEKKGNINKDYKYLTKDAKEIKVKDRNNLQQIHRKSDGTVIKLRNSTKDGRQTIEINKPGSKPTKIRYD